MKKYLLLIVIFITILVYANTFRNQFVIDDTTFINESYGGHLSLGSALLGFVPAGHEGVYRPVRGILYLVYYQLFGTNPWGYHLHALLVHLLCTILVYLIVSELIQKVSKGKKVSKVSNGSPFGTSGTFDTFGTLPFLVALLFGLHPIHTESISYLSSAMDTIGIVFAFGGFYFYLKEQRFLSVSLILLGFFTNEVTLTLPILIVLHEFLFKKHKSFSKTWVYFVGIMCYFLVRFALHISTRGGYPGNNFLMGIGLIPNQIFEFSKMVVLPYPLMHNHILGNGMESILYRGNMVDSSQIISWESLIGVGILVSLVGFGIYFWKRNPLVSYSLGWFLVTLVPVLTIVPQGTLFHERFLYLPSFGFCILLPNLIKNSKAIGFVIVLFAIATFTRIPDWKDPITLWSKDIKIAPLQNAYAYFQRGNAYQRTEDGRQSTDSRRQMTEKAIEDYEKAFEINPHFAVAIASAAQVYQRTEDGGQNTDSRRQRTEKAEELYKKAVAADPYFWEGWFNLGNIYAGKGNLELAVDAYFRASTINPLFAGAKQNLEEVQRLLRLH